jgi:REP element-mobilizing transposase RayT
MLTIRKILDRKRLRWKDHDYSGPYSYFVTICVQDRLNNFGEIVNQKMKLNEYGEIADQQFKWLQNQYLYIEIPIWIVMPNHVHAIIEIDDTRGRSRPTPGNNTELMKTKPLPELIGAYKTTTSKKIHQSGFSGFRWQRSYHERIIRNKIQYIHISEYIRNNPVVMSGRDRTKGNATSGRDRST